jgi:hypothetical protein
MRQKEEFPAVGGGGVQNGKPSHSPPPPPVVAFGLEPACVFKSAGVFRCQNMQAEIGGQSRDFVLNSLFLQQILS